MTDDQALPRIRFSLPRHISWLTIVLALLAGITFIAVSRPGEQYAVPMGMGIEEVGMEYSGDYITSISPMMPSSMPIRDESVSNIPPAERMKGSGMYYPYYDPDIPVTDSREFLKVHYGADM